MDIQSLDSRYVAHTYGRFPVTLVEGKGSRIRDEQGKWYIDMGSGIGVTAFGIADDVWTEAVIGQLVTSLMQQDYPKELFDVYVIPNNCQDDTEAALFINGQWAWEN